jgi:hypothetical protein
MKGAAYLVALAWLSCQCEGFGMMGRSPMPSLRSQRVFLASAPGRRSMVVPKRLITMQVWSSEQSTQEYRDLLNGVVPEKTEDGPSVIVGGHGKLGDFLRVSRMFPPCLEMYFSRPPSSVRPCASHHPKQPRWIAAARANRLDANGRCNPIRCHCADMPMPAAFAHLDGSNQQEKGAGEDILVGRGDEIPGEMRDVGENFPIYVCVPEEEVSESRWSPAWWCGA